MSIYSDISKHIDHDSSIEVGWPDKPTAEKLLAQVQQGNIEAFEKVFRIYRYAITSAETMDSQRIICEAYNVGSNNPDWRQV